MRAPHLKYFAVATRTDGQTQHLSGPHDTSDDAHKHLAGDLQDHVNEGVEIASAGVFSADFEATPIPSKAVAADEKVK